MIYEDLRVLDFLKDYIYYGNSVSISPTSFLESRDFPKECKESIEKILTEQKFLHDNYDYTLPIKEQYTKEELEEGLSKLSLEKAYIIQEVFKYVPSNMFTTYYPLNVTVINYNCAIERINDYMRIMKLENPGVKFKHALQPPPNVVYPPYPRSRSLTGLEVIPVKGSLDELEKYLESAKKQVDRFTGDTVFTKDVINHLKPRKNKDEVNKDELILSQLLSLNQEDDILKIYLTKVSDNDLLLDSNNFLDLYEMVVNIVGGKTKKFTIEKFWRDWNIIRESVFSKDIVNYSPRLIKLAVTIELGDQ